MNRHYPHVAARAGHRCEYCRAPEAVFNFPFEVEHVLPLAGGGTNEESNLALSCRSCNLRKGVSLQCTDPETGNEVPLFNPRQEDWNEHFRLDAESGLVRGVTGVGRAMVGLLQMNGELQLNARIAWMHLGLFP
jgi:hypothetical protein